MAESQEETPSLGHPKKKNSLLDLDFGKDDFLSSWKTSITEDDTMDLDFGPVSKVKKKAFNFDKSSMDFDLDGDFGKIPSFNLDIPDIDISSPVKKDGKPKERSDKDSAVGTTRGKTDRFDFTFDFPELDGFSFKSSSKKEDLVVKGSEEKEDSSNAKLSKKSGECPAEDVDADQHKSGNLPASRNPDSSNENSPSKSATNDGDHLNSTTEVYEGTSQKGITLVEKAASGSNQELDCQPDKSISPEPLLQEVHMPNETVRDESIHFVFRNESCQDSMLEVQEEVSSGDIKASNLEQTANKKFVGASGSNYAIPAWDGSSMLDAAISEDKVGSHVGTDKGAESVQCPTRVEKLSSANASTESVPKTQVNGKNPGKAKLSSAINSRTTTNNLMPEKEREAVLLSKYFRQQDKEYSRVQNASNLTTLASNSERVIGSRKSCPSDESQNRNPVEAENGTVLAGVSLSHSGKELSQIGNWESGRDSKTNRPLDEDVMNEAASKGGEKDGRSLDSFSSSVNTLSLSGLTIKSTTQNYSNPTSLASNEDTNQNRKNSAASGDKLASVKHIKQMPALASLTISRKTLGANLDSSKSQHRKDSALTSDVQQHKTLAGKTPYRTVQVVETKKQPSTPSLKRKMVEACSTDLISNPSKRLSESPRNGHSAEASGKIVDNKACHNENVSDGKSISICKNQENSNPDVPSQVYMNELEVSFSLEHDSNIEIAEACSKGLEDICNTLSKKHEEAKEILVRAIVNNNKLLMLNHPIYEEKIRMVQKFAAQLTLREIHT